MPVMLQAKAAAAAAKANAAATAAANAKAKAHQEAQAAAAQAKAAKEAAAAKAAAEKQAALDTIASERAAAAAKIAAEKIAAEKPAAQDAWSPPPSPERNLSAPFSPDARVRAASYESRAAALQRSAKKIASGEPVEAEAAAAAATGESAEDLEFDDWLAAQEREIAASHPELDPSKGLSDSWEKVGDDFTEDNWEFVPTSSHNIIRASTFG